MVFHEQKPLSPLPPPPKSIPSPAPYTLQQSKNTDLVPAESLPTESLSRASVSMKDSTEVLPSPNAALPKDIHAAPKKAEKKAGQRRASKPKKQISSSSSLVQVDISKSVLNDINGIVASQSGLSSETIVSKVPGQHLEKMYGKHCSDTKTSGSNKTGQGQSCSSNHSGAPQGGAENSRASRKRANSVLSQDEPQKKKARHFMRCSDQDKYLCEVCSKPDCGECENCK